MKMNRSLILFLFGICLTQPIYAQINWQKGEAPNYEYDDVFDSTAALPHGIVVDNFNRVWIGSLHSTGPGLIVRNPDGTEPAFSPITSVTFGQDIITLDDGNCRGMAVDSDGNILYAKGSILININVETGEGITSWQQPESLSLTKPTVDANGNIYVGTVLGVSPIVVLEPIFMSEIAQIVLNPVAELSRGIEITADGKNLWTGNLNAKGPVYQYTTEDFTNYPVSDSILTDADGDTIFQFVPTTMNWGPDSTLWISHETEELDLQLQNGLIVFDFTLQSYSTLFMPDIPGNDFNGPRGVAFSVTGDTAYVASFNGSRVVRFIKSTEPVSVQNNHDRGLPADFKLSQNYPNPFNPVTRIAFNLPIDKRVSLKIYNSLGQEVRNLIDNETYPKGAHTVQWDATDNQGSKVASGVYIYTLTYGNFSKSKTMTFVQ